MAAGAAGLESGLSPFLVTKLEVYQTPLVGHSWVCKQRSSRSTHMSVHIRRVSSTQRALERIPRLTQHRALSP